jgi:hypothetical protein
MVSYGLSPFISGIANIANTTLTGSRAAVIWNVAATSEFDVAEDIVYRVYLFADTM